MDSNGLELSVEGGMEMISASRVFVEWLFTILQSISLGQRRD